jgi:CDP-glucose 4,6-dehydratase
VAVRYGALEGLAVNLFSGIYRNRRVLVTGHTGFKGTWLAQWLVQMGAQVTGIALAPETDPSHWALLSPAIAASRMQDVRDGAAVARLMSDAAPEIVFHMAAQPLVRRSYRDPQETWSVNVMGTLNVLEACRRTPSVRAVVVVTTDKCYENFEIERGYREDDKLGGHDPYSASKAAAELVAASYRKSFFGKEGKVLLATARAGNVIGGGDWSEDRLIPDLVRATAAGRALVIRAPHATRPWQHVLEPLSGYLMLGQKLLEGDAAAAQAWNFGPGDAANRSVAEVLGALRGFWPGISWEVHEDVALHEARLLHLDSAKARRVLGWQPQWPLETCLEETAGWYRAFLKDGTLLTETQIGAFAAAAQARGAAWAA